MYMYKYILYRTQSREHDKAKLRVLSTQQIVHYVDYVVQRLQTRLEGGNETRKEIECVNGKKA